MILGMLRIKNEARWIERVLRSILPLCESVLVFDDHSNDGTAEICRCIEGVEVFDSTFTGLNESRDKNFLMEKAEAFKPEWILHIDGDEELAPGSQETIRQLTSSVGGSEYRFKILYLWNDANTVRVDGIYANFRRTRLFRFQSGARFYGGMGGPANFHCGNAPGSRSPWECDAKILHYGYMNQEDRLRKYEFYNRNDPGNPNEDGYRHMVIGDLFPAESKFRHGGPLQLASLMVEA